MTNRKFLELMREPEDLRKLRRQSDRVKADKALAARRLRESFERDSLRREIIAAGEQPCC